ncbi:class I mannose-6-phosphate isomerase [Sphingobium sp. HBC34]|uniref:Class I mannose-6-phosphate isomerase n=1 Tax=Sphingobium cyanobacteriorum TaxID=3063954 RepID=A0ABT8ZNA9_9SPHN|nr:class I mannose-6-phosphate isomerase [Sphingobium sp. HBC34]MDO7836029.1 class I mannose-6-phosphate isomerase [Sphingobium sp. HBC34]
MSAVRLETKRVVKPWGRTDIGAFPNPAQEQVGEIWFDGPEGRHPPLLVKYIFTSEKLSIQVHPTDAQAQAAGLPGGKSECWYILDAQPGATLGIGTSRRLDDDALRASALDGTLEALMDWKPVQPGSFFYIPAGTVHAIGAGVTLVEVQMNNDVTYRLFDYGRPRELHLDAGVAVSDARPYALPERVIPADRDSSMLDRDTAPFALDMRCWAAGHGQSLAIDQGWFIPLSGSGTIDGVPWRAHECWLVEGDVAVTTSEAASVLIATM